jgi:hypothetical protein
MEFEKATSMVRAVERELYKRGAQQQGRRETVWQAEVGNETKKNPAEKTKNQTKELFQPKAKQRTWYTE